MILLLNDLVLEVQTKMRCGHILYDLKHSNNVFLGSGSVHVKISLYLS